MRYANNIVVSSLSCLTCNRQLTHTCSALTYSKFSQNLLVTTKQIRSVALRNTLPTSSTKIWDRDYTSSYSSRSTLGDTKIGEKKDSSSRYESSSYAAGGNRSSAISPSKTLVNDSIYDRKASSSSTQSVEGLCGLWNIGESQL